MVYKAAEKNFQQRVLEQLLSQRGRENLPSEAQFALKAGKRPRDLTRAKKHSPEWRRMSLKLIHDLMQALNYRPDLTDTLKKLLSDAQIKLAILGEVEGDIGDWNLSTRVITSSGESSFDFAVIIITSIGGAKVSVAIDCANDRIHYFLETDDRLRSINRRRTFDILGMPYPKANRSLRHVIFAALLVEIDACCLKYLDSNRDVHGQALLQTFDGTTEKQIVLQKALIAFCKDWGVIKSAHEKKPEDIS